MIRPVEQIEQHALVPVRTLRGDIDGQRLAHRVRRRDHAAAFHKERPAAVLENRFAEDMRCLRERGVGVADADRNERGEIVGRLAVREQRVARKRLGAIRRCRQRLEIDGHQRSRILGEIAAVGNDDCDRLADEAGFVPGEAIRHEDLFDRRARHQKRHCLPLHGFRQVSVGEHRVHAGQSQRRALVDATDRGVRVGAAQHHGMEHAREVDIVDIAAAAGEQVRVFLALDACAEPFRAHQRSPSRIMLQPASNCARHAACWCKARATARSSAR
jgi:hypothetical protein